MLAVALTMAALVLASQQDICGAQVSIHTDSNTNSFSLKTPGLQQTFTRYYGGARTQPQEAEQPQQGQALVQQQQQQQQQQEQLVNQYQQLSRLHGGKPKAEQSYAAFRQQYQQQQQQQQQPQLLQQQALLAQSGFGSPAGSQGAGAAGLPTYSDQLSASFIDYQRRRAEFEAQQQQQQQQQLQQQQQQQLQQQLLQQHQQQQQQQQLFDRFNHYYPDVSASQGPTQVQPQAHQQQQTAEGLHGANGFAYQRQQFLQPGGSAGPASDFYSTQQHQDVLREQQQLVAQQFATAQMAPTTRTAVPTSSSSAPSAPSFQPSSDVSHVSFSSGNLKYNF